MEILTRATCIECGGTGEAMTRSEAQQKAQAHNSKARLLNFPNYLSAEDFIKCDTCNGTGKEELWIEVNNFYEIFNK